MLQASTRTFKTTKRFFTFENITALPLESTISCIRCQGQFERNTIRWMFLQHILSYTPICDACSVKQSH